MNISDIKVQLVHLDGPFKGEIQDFLEPIIGIGRHPDCQLVFPKDCTAISRKHAEIKREGNRFKFIDKSTNGTLINGKPQKEVFLKDGDVLIIGGEGGPKVSFLSSRIAPEEAQEVASTSVIKVPKNNSPSVSPPVNNVVPPKEEKHSASIPISLPVQKPIVKKAPSQPLVPSVKAEEGIHEVVKNFIIQYGATLTSFKKLPVTIGSGTGCDCTLQHPSLLEEHAQIFFQNDQYWVKDLTGRGLLTVNLKPVQTETPLLPDTCLALTPNGPQFQFLGDGRLAEIEMVEKKMESAPSKKKQMRKGSPQVQSSSGNKMLLWLVIALFGIVGAAVAWYFLEPSSFADFLNRFNIKMP